jgi:hypothetical protein
MEDGWQRKERLGWQLRKKLEAEGSPIMDDRANDGRGGEGRGTLIFNRGPEF